MKKMLALLAVSLFSSVVYSQRIDIKSNLLYDVTTTLNLGAEVGLNRNLSLDVSANYNPWKFGSGRQWKHWLLQPELRYWLGERFRKSFLGVHVHYAGYNVARPEHARYQGNLYGFGFSYGYRWTLKNRWSVEATAGLGYARIKYDKYNCRNCGPKLDSGHKNYFGPTKLGVSLIYTIF